MNEFGYINLAREFAALSRQSSQRLWLRQVIPILLKILLKKCAVGMMDKGKGSFFFENQYFLVQLPKSWCAHCEKNPSGPPEAEISPLATQI
jgi:hypothetical protein